MKIQFSNRRPNAARFQFARATNSTVFNIAASRWSDQWRRPPFGEVTMGLMFGNGDLFQFCSGQFRSVRALSENVFDEHPIFGRCKRKATPDAPHVTRVC